MTVPMTLNDLERRDACTVWLRTTKFGKVTHVAKRPVSRESATPSPYLKGVVPQHPINFLVPLPTPIRFYLKKRPNWGRSVSKIFLGTPTYAHTVRETAAKFCLMIRLDNRKFFTGSMGPPHPLSRPKIYVTQMLKRDRAICLSNLLASCVVGIMLYSWSSGLQ